MPRRPGSIDPAPPVVPPVLLRRDLRPAVAAAALREHRWERVRPGAFIEVRSSLGAFEQVERRALARIAAASAQLAVDHVISHQSAALLWGLPLVGDGSVVHLVQTTTPHRGPADLRRHTHRLAEAEVVDLAGLRVTSLVRTVADCAASLPAADALVVADAALRRGLDREQCLAVLERRAPGRGTRRARDVLQLADEGAESAGESRLRHLALRHGLPVPITQLRVDTADGPAWADLGWPEWCAVAEYDGVAKYTANSTAADAVLRERRREVAVERAGWRVVRATAADLRRPGPFLGALLAHAPAEVRRTLRPRPELS